MTDAELAAIEARCRAATAGPWTTLFRRYDEIDGQKYAPDETPLLVMSPDCESHPVADASCNHTCRMPEDTEANATFIAHSRTDVEALCAEVRRRGPMTAADRHEYAAMILRDYRGVETPCPVCDGWGVRTYGSTACWRGGFGGQALTTGVCDRCWGSGDERRPGANLRELEGSIKRMRLDVAETLTRAEKAEAEVRRLSDALDDEQEDRARLIDHGADRAAGREET